MRAAFKNARGWAAARREGAGKQFYDTALGGLRQAEGLIRR